MRFIPAVSPVRIQSPLPSPARCESISPVPFKGTLLRPVGQVVKTRPFHGCNMGSSPVRVTNGGLAQLVRAPASHAGGHWFESSSLHQILGNLVFPRIFLFHIAKRPPAYTAGGRFCKFSQQQESHANDDDNHTGDVFHDQCPFRGLYVPVLPTVGQMPGVAGLDNDKDTDHQGH